LDDLIGEEPRECGVVCTASRLRLARAWEPFEKKDQGAHRMKRSKRWGVEGVEVINDKRYA
jgi:hypothetical protein